MMSVWDYVKRGKVRNGFDALQDEMLIKFRQKNRYNYSLGYDRYSFGFHSRAAITKFVLARRSTGHIHKGLRWRKCSWCAELHACILAEEEYIKDERHERT